MDKERLAELLVEQLTLKVGSPYSEVQARRHRLLERIGDAAVAPLQRRILHPMVAVRAWAVHALSEVPGDAPVPALQAALSDGADQVRFAAACGLAARGDSHGIETLLVHAGPTNSFWPRQLAITALGEVRDPRALQMLFAASSDGNSNIRMRASVALRRIGAPAVEGLLGLLHHDVAHVRRDACFMLGHIGDPRAQEPLLDRLRDEAYSVRSGAAWALGKLGASAAIEPLVSATTDSESLVRNSAFEALGRIGGERALEVLLGAVGGNGARSELVSITGALGSIQDPRAESALVELLKGENDEWVLDKALRGLGHHGGALAAAEIEAFQRDRVRKFGRKRRRRLARVAAFAEGLLRRRLESGA